MEPNNTRPIRSSNGLKVTVAAGLAAAALTLSVAAVTAGVSKQAPLSNTSAFQSYRQGERAPLSNTSAFQSYREGERASLEITSAFQSYREGERASLGDTTP
jgi:hypothetical protein